MLSLTLLPSFTLFELFLSLAGLTLLLFVFFLLLVIKFLLIISGDWLRLATLAEVLKHFSPKRLGLSCITCNSRVAHIIWSEIELRIDTAIGKLHFKEVREDPNLGSVVIFSLVLLHLDKLS